MNIYKVLIASPNDVLHERDIVERSVNDWNREHSEDFDLVYLPVRWEKDSTPRQGKQGQEIIHEDLTRKCDVLIGLFWTTLGTAAGDGVSGTIEEVLEFIQAGKPHAILFKDANVPIKHDAERLAELIRFKSDIHSNPESKFKGLTRSFAEDQTLEKLIRQYLNVTARSIGRLIPQTVVLPSSQSAINRSPGDAAVLVKSYLSDPSKQIQLHDMLINESKRVHTLAINEEIFPLQGDMSGESLDQRFTKMEEESATLMNMFAVAGYWVSIDQLDIWKRSLSRLAQAPMPLGTWLEPLYKMRRYPAMLALYAFGISAVERNKIEELISIFSVSLSSPAGGPDGNAASSLIAPKILDPDLQRRLPGRGAVVVPISIRLSDLRKLRDAVSDYVSTDEEFIRQFDYFEYLLGLCAYAVNNWPMYGVFVDRGYANGEPDRIEACRRLEREIPALGQQHPLLKYAPFGGTQESLQRIKSDFEQNLKYWKRG